MKSVVAGNTDLTLSQKSKMAQRKAHKVEDRERTDDIHIEESVDFNGMYLSDHVQQGLKSSGFERPSPIQLAAIPLGRCGLDLVVQAKSGTGKTCVFTVIALEMISVSAPTTQVLVIAPTREIAVQITQVINAIGSTMPRLRAFTFIGGIHLSEDKAKLNCCHIAVGTPGRLTQLVELGLLKVDNIRLFVLDEADQLLTGQFTESVVHLASTLPLNKQIIALSATYTEDVAKVAEGLMRSPNHVRLGRESPALLGVNQFVRLLPYHHQPYRRQQIKFTELMALLATVTFNQCLVFSSSQLRAESICNALKASGWPVSYLTGGQTQSDRLQALEALCSYKCRVLVSTDLSARGLDSEHVNLVVNLDMPRDHATYLHRIGRAGRFGSRGGAITLVTEGEEWQAMRAIASLANVRVYLLQDGWKSSIANNDTKSMEELEFLSDDELQLWLKNNSSQVYGSKSNDKTKEAVEKESKGNGKAAKLREKTTIKGTNESLEDSGKENRGDNTNS
ncbi:probable ATP-dependent RNA helicase DDX20 isoform X1 [Procambarus clarkii]|uniref:probable ATP-dependent RNA helicase DDX20 isoform X1 n=2 Tax=Procambarus clarkii TaxID=6728 RepID=UPI0037440E06